MDRAVSGFLRRLTGGLHVRSAVITAAIVGVLWGAPYAWAAMTVFDPTAQGSRIEQLNNAVKQLEEAKARLAELERQTQILGTRGALPMADGSANLVNRSARLACSLVNFDEWDLGPDLQVPNIASLCQLKGFLAQSVVAVPDEETGHLSNGVVETVKRRRVEAMESAGVNGLATGLSERETSGQAMAELQSVAAAAAVTTTLREDMAVSNRLALRQVEELIAIRSMLGALLEVQSAQALQGTPILTKPSGTASGILPRAPAGDDPFGSIE
jgi:hypothetical protein